MIQFLHEAVSHGRKNKLEMAILHAGIEVFLIAYKAELEDGSELHQLENLLYQAHGATFMEVTIVTAHDVPERFKALAHHLRVYSLNIEKL